MRTYFVPSLFLLFLTACKDKPQSGAGAAKDSAVAVSSTDTTVPQATTVATIVPTIKQVLTHIPDGYQILDTCSGDLNLDQYVDYLVLLAQNGEDSLSKTSGDDIKRRLLILTGTGGSYALAAQSDNAVYCSSCGGMMGDPYQKLVIKNGYFSIEHYGGSADRWTRTITFKYSTADSSWFLHKDGHESFSAVDEKEKKTTKVYTVKDFGKVKFAEFDVYKY